MDFSMHAGFTNVLKLAQFVDDKRNSSLGNRSLKIHQTEQNYDFQRSHRLISSHKQSQKIPQLEQYGNFSKIRAPSSTLRLRCK